MHFGHHGTGDGHDPVSQFQRAFPGLGSAEKITRSEAANQLLDVQIQWHNRHHVCRTTGLTPDAAWELALKEKRSHLKLVPPTPLLDLHFALYLQRKVNRDRTVNFLGRAWPIGHTGRKSVTIVHHPAKCFWGIPESPSPHKPVWPDILANHKLT